MHYMHALCILAVPLLSRKQNGTKRSLSRCLFLNGCPKHDASARQRRG
jgi:hypothetical protein